MKTKKTGLQMLNDISKGMNKGIPKGIHRAMKPMGVNQTEPSLKGGNMFGNKFGSQNVRLGGSGAVGGRGVAFGQGQPFEGDWAFNGKTARKPKRATKPHLKPKGKRGKAQVSRLNRTYKTGGFSKIAAAAGKKYGSTAAGKRVAGAIFNNMAKARGNA